MSSIFVVESKMGYKTELKSNTEWKQWGQDDPLWSVVSWADKQKDGNSPWTEEEFYAVGESDFQDFIRQWQHYGVNHDSCLEIGCGAGRLTKQLASTFQQVYAVDVSEDMINRARKAVGANVQFSVIDGLHLPQVDGSVKAVFSALVLQHLDNIETGFSYFREFFRVLDTGGTLMVQVPVYLFPYHSKRMQSLMEVLHTSIRQLGSIRADMKRRAGVKLMRVTPYPVELLRDFLTGIGFKSIEFRLFSLKSNGDFYSFVFATK
jgi:ubiquinone/menaquinone biosynthesis C-methylase UbiE